VIATSTERIHVVLALIGYGPTMVRPPTGQCATLCLDRHDEHGRDHAGTEHAGERVERRTWTFNDVIRRIPRQRSDPHRSEACACEARRTGPPFGSSNGASSGQFCRVSER